MKKEQKMKTQKTFNTVSNYKDLMAEMKKDNKETRIMLVSLTPANARDILANHNGRNRKTSKAKYKEYYKANRCPCRQNGNICCRRYFHKIQFLLVCHFQCFLQIENSLFHIFSNYSDNR